MGQLRAEPDTTDTPYTVHPSLIAPDAIIAGDLVVIADHGSDEANQAAANQAAQLGAL